MRTIHTSTITMALVSALATICNVGAAEPNGAPRTTQLFGIDWYGQPADAAKAVAAKGPDAGKPIFCFRVLGDLTGYM